jgi:Domain of unknown function (DUF4396)
VPASARLNRLATSATVHCLTGCAIGEVSGMAIGTALGWGNLTTTLVAIVLAFFFGYSLTAVPLLRSGMAFAAVVPVALGSDTVSIVIMEAVDNGFVALVPGALDAGLADWLFWTSIAGGFALAFGPAFAANRYLIARGRGHALVHEHHDH